MSEGTNGVRVFLEEGLRCSITARNHRFEADEPQALGGSDKAATPTEMLLASLGACTAITMRMYANRKEWPLEAVEIELTHDWVGRDEWEDWPEGDERKKLPRVKEKIRVHGNLDAEQVERLRYIARRCVVHRIVTENPAVVQDLERAD
jgi:putative redox protein